MPDAAAPLTLTAYPADEPHDRWEVTAPSGAVLISGTTFPIDEQAVRTACRAYWLGYHDAQGSGSA